MVIKKLVKEKSLLSLLLCKTVMFSEKYWQLQNKLPLSLCFCRDVWGSAILIFHYQQLQIAVYWGLVRYWIIMQ